MTDIASQVEVVSTLQNVLWIGLVAFLFVDSIQATNVSHKTDLPHLLFYGPPEQERPQPFWPCQNKCLDRISRTCIELNASTHRGIRTIHLSLSILTLTRNTRIQCSREGKMFAQGSVCRKAARKTYSSIQIDRVGRLTSTSAAQVRFTLKTHTRTCIYSLALM